MFIIYKLTNKINDKQYVGFTTKDVTKRLREHLYCSRRRTKIQHLHSAIRKYGIDNFLLEILEMGENAEYGLKIAEPLYIAWLRPEYNKTNGGEGILGLKFSESHRKNLSEVRKGTTPWNKGMTGLPGPNKGKIFSVEHKERLRISHLGLIPWNKGLNQSI